MKIKFGYFIPPLILLAFAVCALMFGGTMYKNYQVEEVLKSKDKKAICLTDTYGIKQDANKKYLVLFDKDRKFYLPGYIPVSKAGYIVVVVDGFNRTLWTAISNDKMVYIRDVYKVPMPGCLDEKTINIR